MRSTTPTTWTRRVAVLAAAAAVGCWSGASFASEPAENDRGTEAADAESRTETWSGLRWRLRGRSVERGAGWVAVEGARARTMARATDEYWEIRADRLVAWLSRPGRIAAWWARGDVRVVGAKPVYATGAEAVSFRPARSITLLGGDRRAERLGADGDLAGGRVDVDLRRNAATIFDVGGR